jgi:hypothetical protein
MEWWKMRISLIGMSGSGKSYWSARLSEFGFRRFCCDELITTALSSDLKREDGTGMELGEWMGFPFDPGYESREAKYLSCEIDVLTGILDWLETRGNAGTEENVVVDTTGSVIYTGEALLKRLKSLTTMVHFTSPPHVREDMLAAYMAKPRPVLWRGIFNRRAGESDTDALIRCYELLLNKRELLYHDLADVELDYATRRGPDFDVSTLLELAGGKTGVR